MDFSGIRFSKKRIKRSCVSGLILTKYRGYDANNGRWISRDPLKNAEFREDVNLYEYCKNNFLNYIDNNGKMGLRLKREPEKFIDQVKKIYDQRPQKPDDEDFKKVQEILKALIDCSSWKNNTVFEDCVELCAILSNTIGEFGSAVCIKTCQEKMYSMQKIITLIFLILSISLNIFFVYKEIKKSAVNLNYSFNDSETSMVFEIRRT